MILYHKNFQHKQFLWKMFDGINSKVFEMGKLHNVPAIASSLFCQKTRLNFATVDYRKVDTDQTLADMQRHHKLSYVDLNYINKVLMVKLFINPAISEAWKIISFNSLLDPNVKHTMLNVCKTEMQNILNSFIEFQNILNTVIVAKL